MCLFAHLHFFFLIKFNLIGCCFHFYMSSIFCFLLNCKIVLKKQNKTKHKRKIVYILHYCSVLRKHILISETWVISLLITEGSSPSSFTLTRKAWLAGSMARSMHTNFLVTRLTTWQNSHLQRHISEVLEFAVDIQITDAAMEACAILSWRLA